MSKLGKVNTYLDVDNENEEQEEKLYEDKYSW
ncbi:Uncharacterised protein, partial [Mycoplasmopsis synoviae]